MPHKFQLDLRWPVERGAQPESRPMTIQMRDPVKTDRHESTRTWRAEFSFKIPDAIWSQLVGKVLPAKRKGSSENDSKKYGSDTRSFPKTLADTSIFGLCHKWEEMVDDYEWSILIDRSEMERVIFYSLGGSISEFAYSTWNRDKHGNITQGKLVYGHGFRLYIPELESEYRKHEGEFRYTSERKLVPSYQNEAFYELKWVRWSEQRQAFFDELQRSFTDFINRLNTFEGKLSESFVDKLLTGDTAALEEMKGVSLWAGQ